MAYGDKPFRQVVAEHYIETGETITSKDVARDFQVHYDVANSVFKGIWHSGRYRCDKFEQFSPHKMRVLGVNDNRGKKTYTDVSKVERKTAKAEQETNRDVERLKLSFCGLR